MLSKRIIATLIAGSFAAAQAGAHNYLSDAAGSISDRGYQAQASESMLSEDSYPRYLTVFNPDGTSYSLVADAYTVTLEPELLVMTSESSMPEHLTVFDPDGTVTEYHFTPVDVAYFEPQYDVVALELGEAAAEELAALNADRVILVQVSDPIIVAMTDDESASDRVVWFDAEGAPWSTPTHRAALAAFDEALERTG